MNCPICGAEATNATPGNFDGLVVECKHCGDYEIPDNALNALIRLDFDGREAALKKAKAAVQPGQRASIECAYL